MSRSLERNMAALERRRREEEASTSPQERVASAIARFAGSMACVYIHLVLYGGWALLSLGVPPVPARFQPGLGLLSNVASVEALFLTLFVLINQNRAGRLAEKRADLDLHITLLTEHELTKLIRVVSEIAEHQGIALESDLEDVTNDVAPEAVLDELDEHERKR